MRGSWDRRDSWDQSMWAEARLSKRQAHKGPRGSDRQAHAPHAPSSFPHPSPRSSLLLSPPQPSFSLPPFLLSLSLPLSLDHSLPATPLAYSAPPPPFLCPPFPLFLPPSPSHFLTVPLCPSHAAAAAGQKRSGVQRRRHWRRRRAGRLSSSRRGAPPLDERIGEARGAYPRRGAPPRSTGGRGEAGPSRGGRDAVDAASGALGELRVTGR